MSILTRTAAALALVCVTDPVQGELVEPLRHSVYYIPDAKVMLCVLPKAGSSSFFQWLYNASTGGQNWEDCPNRMDTRNVHASNVRSKCWESVSGERQHKFNIFRIEDLPTDVQQEVATSDDVFRFSLVREPVSRAISGWKSKLACDSTGYIIDTRDRPIALEELYKITQSPFLLNVDCLDLEEFADELIKIKMSGKMHLLHKSKMVDHFSSSSLTCAYDHIKYQQIALLESFKYTEPSVQLRYLADRLHLSLDEFPYGHAHSSSTSIQRPKRDINMTASLYAKLHTAYSMDFASLGDLLFPGMHLD